MSPSRLPINNETSSYRPSGMLDRDQRTAFTIDRIRDNGGDSILISNNLTNTQLKLNHQYNNRASECICYSKTIILRQDTVVNKSRMIRLSGSHRSRTKFINFLLIFSCIWLATTHCTFAYPLAQLESQSKMSINRERCEAVQKALDNPIQQTKISYKYIPTQVEKYVEAQFKKKPEQEHAEWRDHSPHFDYLNGSDREINLPKDYGDDFPDSYVDHIRGPGAPSEQEIVDELRRIYAGLMTLHKVFQKINANRETNATQILHHLNNDIDAHNTINEVFKEQYRYTRYDINEIKAAMDRLKIPIPTLNDVELKKKDRVIGEWLATREYLKVLSYIRKVYDILHQRCS